MAASVLSTLKEGGGPDVPGPFSVWRALVVAHYNLCRVHEALRVTPAMQLGVTDHIWTVSELVQAVLTGMVQEPEGRKAGKFRVIEGGA